MGEYIKKSDAIETFCSKCRVSAFEYGVCRYDFIGECFEIYEIKSIPSADVIERSEHEAKVNEIILAHADWKPIRHGKWIHTHEDGHGSWVGTCNLCNKENKVNNFCPNCGADMRGTDDE